MAKVVNFATKALAFFKSAQGKRDVALVVAAVGAVADVAKQFKLI